MIKTLDVINEALKIKTSTSATNNQPKKAMKNRYERRKIREYLHLGDWLAEELA